MHSGSAESRTEYRRILAELEAGGGRYQDTGPNKAVSDLTVAEMLLRGVNLIVRAGPSRTGGIARARIRGGRHTPRHGDCLDGR